MFHKKPQGFKEQKVSKKQAAQGCMEESEVKST